MHGELSAILLILVNSYSSHENCSDLDAKNEDGTTDKATTDATHLFNNLAQ